VSEGPDQPETPPTEGEPRVPNLHLERLEAMARRAPHELAQRADEAIARHIPALAPSRLGKRIRRRTVALFVMLGVMAVMASAWAVLRETTVLR
jgi:type VI protein secretion system component VasF